MRGAPLQSLPRWLATIGAIGLSAALYACAFPPRGAYLLAWIALVPLFLALGRATPLAGFALATTWSLLVGLGTAPFLPEMISTFFGVDRVWAWATAAGAILETGVLYGVFGAWLATQSRSGPVHPLWVAGAWGGCEWARSVVFVPNPWALSGYSQLPFEAIMQSADLAGPFGIGMLIAAVNAMITGLLQPALYARRALPAVAALALACFVYGQIRLRQEFASGPELTVALVQAAVERGSASSRDNEYKLLQQLSLSLDAASQAPDLILWPEYALDRAPHLGSPELLRLSRLSRATDADLLVGAPLYEDLLVSRRRFNSVFLVSGDALSGRYDKVALLPFSESNPVGAFYRAAGALTPGDSHAPVASRAGPIGVLLCNEAMLSAPAREAVRAGAELLANPANDDWFGAEGALQQLAIARVRAIENRRFLVRPAQSGLSAVVDPHGRVRASTTYGHAQVLVERIRRSTASTAYQWWGDAIPQAAGLLTGLVSVRSHWRRRTGGSK